MLIERMYGKLQTRRATVFFAILVFVLSMTLYSNQLYRFMWWGHMTHQEIGFSDCNMYRHFVNPVPGDTYAAMPDFTTTLH